MAIFSGVTVQKALFAIIIFLLCALLGIILYLLSFLPLWFIATTLLALGVYWFDKLPYQHHWNLSVRDLYPYRQSWPERKVMVLLHRANIFHSRRWRKQVELPPELWVQIILWSIDSPYDFATLCEPKDFHLFVRGHNARQKLPFEFQKLYEWTKEIRLVSHLWAETLNRHSQWVIAPGWPKLKQPYLHRGVRRVDLDPGWLNEPLLYPSIPNTLQDEANLSIPLPELSVVSVRIQDRFHVDIYNRVSSGVYTHAARFRGARCFILNAADGHLATDTLAGIERSFSNITSLTLIARQITGVLSLEHLEILILSAEQVETQLWNLPRLAHLALVTERRYNLQYTEALFPRTSLQLRSLYVDPSQALTINEDFWSYHPSLEFIGISSPGFRLTHPPPSGHPLAHLYFCDSSSSIKNMDLQHVTTIVNSIPQLRTIVVPHNYPNSRDTYPAAWGRLARATKRRGLRWIGPDGEEVRSLSPISTREERPWEQWWIRIYALHSLYDAVRLYMLWDHYGFHIGVARTALMGLYTIFIWSGA